MPKFGTSTGGMGGGVRTIAVVDTSVSMSFRRRAKITFWLVSVAVAVPSAVLFSVSGSVLLAVLFGVFVGCLCGAVAAVVTAVWPVLRVFWHWAPELVFAGAAVYGWAAVLRATSPVVSALVLVIVAGVGALIRPVRRWVMAWGWCLIVRHRLRGCFRAIIRPAGTLAVVNSPFILLARPTPAGERVWVWLRPGLALGDLEGQTDKLAVACWGAEVRVVRVSSSYAALVRIDISRRDPLTGEVPSPLPLLIPDDNDAPKWKPGVDWETLDGLDLADIPDPTNDTPASDRGRRERAPRQPRNNRDVSPGDVDPNDAFI
jgi:hypothetical protein